MKLGKYAGLVTLLVGLNATDASAIVPSPYFVVADDTIAPHLVQDHETALARFKQKADETGYQQSWRFYQFDDGRHVAFNAQKSHDYQAQSDADWAEVAEHFDAEFLASNGAVYTKTITQQDYFLISYRDSMSSEPPEEMKSPYSHMVFVEIQLNRDANIRNSFSEWVVTQKKAKTPLYFSTYVKQYGSNLPTIFLVFHSDSIFEFYKNLEQKGVFDPVQLLPQEVKKSISEYRISLAKYLPQISY
ncbi:MAG: hypothetical protein Alis3KO_40750 [Aliiglaciecola sp.]